MDREKHEHFHSWLRWKKEKTGKYPPNAKQKEILESEYGGTLLENVRRPVEANDTPRSSSTVVHQENSKPELLFAELKKERLRLAREFKIPAYLIFHDSTLTELANAQPTSEQSMRQIRGVGPEKMQKFGHSFLNIILSFKAKTEEESA